MDVDTATLAQLGVSAAMIPFAGSIVKNTVDIFKGSYDLDSKQCVAVCYCLSFFLICLLQFLTPVEISVIGISIFTAKTLITGWLTANWAAMSTNTHDKAREDRAKPIIG